MIIILTKQRMSSYTKSILLNDTPIDGNCTSDCKKHSKQFFHAYHCTKVEKCPICTARLVSEDTRLHFMTGNVSLLHVCATTKHYEGCSVGPSPSPPVNSSTIEV